MVKGVDVGRASTHTGENYALGSSGKVGSARGGTGGESLLGGNPRKSQVTEPC